MKEGNGRSRMLLAVTVMLTAFFLLVFTVLAGRLAAPREREFEFYLKQAGLTGARDGDDVIRCLGEPERILYEPESDASYVRICYDGLEFGILGGSLSDRVVMIRIRKPGLVRLRGGVDVGADWEDAENAYRSAEEIVDAPGFILGGRHEISDGGGVWIYMELDNQDRICEITITDGL